MPLSEHEQRQFDAIERALYADDPKFAHKLRATNPRKSGRRVFFGGVLIVVVGVGVLVAGPFTGNWYVGVLGFLVMLLGATRAYAGFKRWTGTGDSLVNSDGTIPFRRRRSHRPGRPRNKGAARHSFREAMEERWRRRMDGDGRY